MLGPFYPIDVPVPIAVGIDLSIVAPLLAGSALGAQVGSAATSIVDEEVIEIYVGLRLLGGTVAVAFRQIGEVVRDPRPEHRQLRPPRRRGVLVSGAVVYSSLTAIRRDNTHSRATGPLTGSDHRSGVCGCAVTAQTF